MNISTDHRIALIERLNDARECLTDISIDLRVPGLDKETVLLYEVDRALQVVKIDFLVSQLRKMNIFM